jgi:catechol 2,3-dioxygenase-like lactoylglutathione lyase family enzyme
MNLNQITLPVRDVQEAVDFYQGMGFLQIVDSPHYSRFEAVEGDATFSVHQSDEAGAGRGVIVYFETQRLDALVDELQAKGYEFIEEPDDKPWLWREARLNDPSGNEICLYLAGEYRRNPPWRVNRK